jgi:uncharacterized membrane protein/transcriptional regulator
MKNWGMVMMWSSLMPLFMGVTTGIEFHFFTAFMLFLAGFFAYKKGEKAEVKIKIGLNKAVNAVSDVTEVKEAENSQYKLMLVAAMVALFVAIFDMPSGYYDFLRIVVFITTGLTGIYFLNKNESSSGIALLLIAILWNPVIPIYIYEKSVWVVLDLIAIVIITFILNTKSFTKSVHDNKSVTKSVDNLKSNTKSEKNVKKSVTSDENTSESNHPNTNIKKKDIKVNLCKSTLGDLFKNIKSRKIDHNNFVKKYQIHIFNFITGFVLGDNGYQSIDEINDRKAQRVISIAKKELSSIGISIPDDLDFDSQINSILNQSNKEHAIIIKNILDLNKFGLLMSEYRKNGDDNMARSTINNFVDACINNLSFNGGPINKITK